MLTCLKGCWRILTHSQLLSCSFRWRVQNNRKQPHIKNKAGACAGKQHPFPYPHLHLTNPNSVAGFRM